MESPRSELPSCRDSQPHWIKGLPLWSVVIALALVCYLMLLDVSIVSTAVPRITGEFHSLADVGWYASAYQLSNAALQPLTGKIYANFYPKWTFFVFFFVFEIGSLICALATSSSHMLIVGRAVAGIGASGIQNGAVTMISGMVPLEKRPAFIGMVMGISQLGLASGPLVGGALTEYTTWRWCFWINLPVGGVVAGLMLFFRIPDPIPKQPPLVVLCSLHVKLDFLGFVGFAGSVVMLLMAIHFGSSEYPWNSATVIGLFCGSGATFLIWFAWNWRKGDAALIPRSLMGKRAIWSSCATYGLSMGSLFTASYYLPIYFQEIRGSSPFMSGVQILPNVIPQVILAVLCGTLVTRLGYYLPFSLVGAALFSIGAGLISTYSPTTPLARRIGYQILLGAGFGMELQMPIIAIQNSVQPQQIPVAMSTCMFSQQLAGSLLVSFGNTILINSLKTLLPKYAPSVNPGMVSTAGATALRDTVPPSVLDGVLIAYSKSEDRVYYLAAACGAASFFTAWGMGWKDVRKNRLREK